MRMIIIHSFGEGEPVQPHLAPRLAPVRVYEDFVGLLASLNTAVAGAAIGFLTGIVLSTGSLSVPVFASYRLVNEGLALDRGDEFARDA